MPDAGFFSALGRDVLIAYGALVIGIMLLVDGLFHFASAGRLKGEARVNRRLQMLSTGTDPRRVLEQLRRATLHPLVSRLKPLAWLDRMMRQAAMTTSLGRLAIIMFACAGAAYVLLVGKMPNGLVAVAVAVAVGIGLPVIAILRQRKKRVKLLTEQLPDALDLLVRGLRVGHPLSSALATVAEELPDPVGSEAGIVVDEMTYGLSLRQAIENMRERVPADDLHYFAVALQIQHGTGGNLAEVLQGLSKLIRERLQFFRKVRAVTGHARMVSIFASLFPLLIPVGLNWIMPDFYGAVSDRPWFPWVIGGGVFMCFMNYLVMRWMVVVKV
jgi:tight adherence protein B